MRAHSTAVSMEERALRVQCGGQPFGPHLPNPVTINHTQDTTTNTQTLYRDWFYSRPMAAAEPTMWVALVTAWVIHNSSQPVLTKLSLFNFCDRMGTGIF